MIHVKHTSHPHLIEMQISHFNCHAIGSNFNLHPLSIFTPISFKINFKFQKFLFQKCNPNLFYWTFIPVLRELNLTFPKKHIFPFMHLIIFFTCIHDHYSRATILSNIIFSISAVWSFPVLSQNYILKPSLFQFWTFQKFFINIIWPFYWTLNFHQILQGIVTATRKLSLFQIWLSSDFLREMYIVYLSDRINPHEPI